LELLKKKKQQSNFVVNATSPPKILREHTFGWHLFFFSCLIFGSLPFPRTFFSWNSMLKTTQVKTKQNEQTMNRVQEFLLRFTVPCAVGFKVKFS
jgi:hypothetical protein